jgi:hypothetical protein
MYLIPLLALALVIVIGVIWSPVFALIIAVPAFLAFLAYVGLKPRSDEKVDAPRASAGRFEDDTHTGAWGEPRP